MNTTKSHRVSTSLRGALTLTWDLNIRAIPTSLVWAISLMFIFQAPNIFLSLACSFLCSVVSLLNCSLVKFSHIRVKPRLLITMPEFHKLLLLNSFLGGLFVAALSNVLNLKPDSIWISLCLTSVAITLFILWICMMLIYNPIFVTKVASQSPSSSLELFMLYAQKRKRELILVGVILVIFTPVVFVFISIALTLTQALTLITLDELTSNTTSEETINHG